MSRYAEKQARHRQEFDRLVQGQGTQQTTSGSSMGRHMLPIGEQIIYDLGCGRLSGNVMDLFDMRGDSCVGINTGSHLYVLRSGYTSLLKGSENRFAIALVEAPFGTLDDMFSVGVETRVANLFSENGPHFVLAFRSFLLGLVPEEEHQTLRDLVDHVADKEVARMVNSHQQQFEQHTTNYLRMNTARKNS